MKFKAIFVVLLFLFFFSFSSSASHVSVYTNDYSTNPSITDNWPDDNYVSYDSTGDEVDFWLIYTATGGSVNYAYHSITQIESPFPYLIFDLEFTTLQQGSQGRNIKIGISRYNNNLNTFLGIQINNKDMKGVRAIIYNETGSCNVTDYHAITSGNTYSIEVEVLGNDTLYFNISNNKYYASLPSDFLGSDNIYNYMLFVEYAWGAPNTQNIGGNVDNVEAGYEGTPIPEFSTLLIPVIGMIALFVFFKRKRKISHD